MKKELNFWVHKTLSRLVWSPCCPRDSQESSPASQFKSIHFWCWNFCTWYWKNHSFDYLDLCWQNAVSTFYYNVWFVIVFLPRSKALSISWLQSMTTMIFSYKKEKYAIVSTSYSSICHKVMGPDAMTLLFRMLSFKPVFHSPLSPSSRGSLVYISIHCWTYYFELPIKKKTNFNFTFTYLGLPWV